tara:strand:+ start:183 stop:656 length:474 start_codon:yes stop_codon:yes gene_type:complete
MENEWFGMAASAAGGGLFGVIGTALGRIAGYFEKRQEQKFEMARWGHESDLLRLQMDAKREETEAEIALTQAQGSWDGLAASLNAEASIPDSYKWVNAVRALTRPCLTFLLWLLCCLVFFGVDGGMRGRIVETAVFAATAATLWWFGDRSSVKERRI